MNPGWLARLRFTAELWWAARTLPFRVRNKSLDAVLCLTEAQPVPAYAGLTPAYIATKIRRVVRGPFMMRDRRCLRIGILGFRFLRKAGYTPELHFGLNPHSLRQEALEAHCWVCLGGAPAVGEPMADMVTILVHTSDNGTPEQSSFDCRKT